MKPKIFVSSTYYDLKYIRENIEKLLENLGFDCILFESGDVTFEHDKPLDASCYKEVSNANMLLLIVGGRYGARSTLIDSMDYYNRYDKYFTSITKSEFLTARDKGLPVYIFVEKNVLSEYETFKKNRDIYYELEKNDDAKKIEFAFVDSVNVFEFIGDLYMTGLPIYSFSKFEDIERQFKSQVSGLLYLYLEGLILKKKDKKIVDSVENITNLIERMETMIQSVGEKVLENSPEVLEKIKKEQIISLLTFCAKQMGRKVSTSVGDEKNKNAWNRLAEYLIDSYLFHPTFEKIISTFEQGWNEKVQQYREKVSTEIKTILKPYKIDLDSIDNKGLEDLADDIRNYMSTNNELKSVYKDLLSKELNDNWLPF